MSWDLSILQWFVDLRNPILDKISYYITMLGSENFYMIALTVIFWCISKRFGRKLVLAAILSDYTNSALKQVFKIARPEGKWPGEIEAMHSETGGGYGFPSGHAQGSATFWTSLATGIKRSWFTILAVVTFLLIGLSRLYLAVHSPSDVLVGWIVGLLVVLLTSLIFKWFERSSLRLKLQKSWGLSLILAAVLPLILLAFNYTIVGFKSVGFMIGFLLGWILEERYVKFDVKASFIKHILKVVIGLGGVFGLRVGLKPVLAAIIPASGILASAIGTVGAPEPITLAEGIAGLIRYAAMSFYGVYVAPLIFKALKLSGVAASEAGCTDCAKCADRADRTDCTDSQSM
ncbi:MAG: phosphatase PAP2 family protein [Bacillota bacterium]|jgi:membrane-associated phospholipid phosphatase